jgi:starvation-inducible outer membrane lipoprotein
MERCEEVNVKIFGGLLILSWTMVSACAPTHHVFPPKTMEGIDTHFDFSRWRLMTDGSDMKKVQLGGRIVRTQSSDDTVIIVVSQLPIVDYPAYGPKDNGENNGEFVIIYQGTIEMPNLQPGNRLIAVGATRPQKIFTFKDISRSFPVVAAQCLHFWNTQGREISDFPFYEAGYVTLRQETVCTSTPTHKMGL